MTNALPARKDSQVRETVLSPVAPQGFPGQTNLIDFGFDGFPDPLRAAPGLELLKSAAFFIDAANAKTGDAYAFNQGTGGFALDARYGSSLAIGAADTNDPLLLPWTGTNYLYCPGVAGNSASTPDSAALDITGDIEMVCRVALDDWTPTTAHTFMAKRDASASYLFRIPIASPGKIEIAWWTAAVATVAQSTINLPATDGVCYWLKATLDVDNGAAGNDTKFYYAADQATEPTVWTQLGATVTVAGTTSIDAGTSPLYVGIGNANISDPISGKLYRAIVRNGIGGTTVFDADFTTGITTGAQTTFTESSSNAATVTINRATAGRKSVAVTRPVWLLGTDDYMEVADNNLLNFSLTDSFTLVAAIRLWATSSNNVRIFSKGAAGTPSNPAICLLQKTTLGVSMRMDAGVSQDVLSPVSTAGALTVFFGVRNTATDSLVTYSGASAGASTTDNTTLAVTNTAPFRIGADYGGGTASFFGEFEMCGAAVFRRALTATEIATISTYYGTA